MSLFISVSLKTINSRLISSHSLHFIFHPSQSMSMGISLNINSTRVTIHLSDSEGYGFDTRIIHIACRGVWQENMVVICKHMLTAVDRSREFSCWSTLTVVDQLWEYSCWCTLTVVEVMRILMLVHPELWTSHENSQIGAPSLFWTSHKNSHVGAPSVVDQSW